MINRLLTLHVYRKRAQFGFGINYEFLPVWHGLCFHFGPYGIDIGVKAK